MPSGGRNAYNTSLNGRWRLGVKTVRGIRTSDIQPLALPFIGPSSWELNTARHWWQPDSQGSSVLVRAQRLHIKASKWATSHFVPGAKITRRISPSTASRQLPLVERESSGRGDAPPHFDVFNERQRPPWDASVLLLWRSSHGRGPCSDFGPLSPRPTLRAGWGAWVHPLWDAVQMMRRWTSRSATGLHFRGALLRDVPPHPLPLLPLSCT